MSVLELLITRIEYPAILLVLLIAATVRLLWTHRGLTNQPELKTLVGTAPLMAANSNRRR